MRLPDDIGPTFSGPGSPGPRRRVGRKKTLAAALAVTATGVACLVPATTASAATVGHARVYVRQADLNNWRVGWATAWDGCRAVYPTTKSVEMTGNGRDGSAGYYQVWACRNTP